MASDISAPAVTVRTREASGETAQPAVRHRQQDAERGEQRQPLADPAGRLGPAQSQIGADAGERAQVGRRHPGNVQRTQREPGDEREVCDQEDTSCHTDADRGAAADGALTLHAPQDAPPARSVPDSPRGTCDVTARAPHVGRSARGVSRPSPRLDARRPGVPGRERTSGVHVVAAQRARSCRAAEDDRAVALGRGASRRTCRRSGRGRTTGGPSGGVLSRSVSSGSLARGPLTRHAAAHVRRVPGLASRPPTASWPAGRAAPGPPARAARRPPCRPGPARRGPRPPAASRTAGTPAPARRARARPARHGPARRASTRPGRARDRSRSAPRWPGSRSRRAAAASRAASTSGRRTVRHGAPGSGPWCLCAPRHAHQASALPARASSVSARGSSAVPTASRGSRSVNTAPPSGEFAAVISPPWMWAFSRAMDRPEPAALGTGAGGARLVEAVEDVRQHVLGDARPVVAHLDDQSRRRPPARTDTRTGEPPCLRALPMRLARITSRRRGSSRAMMPRSASRSTASSQARASMHARDLVGDVDVVQDQPGGARVEAGDLHQVLHQVVRAAGSR